jgi:HEAT repeat protein
MLCKDEQSWQDEKTRSPRRSSARWRNAALLVLGASLSLPGVARAQEQKGDPVRRLRGALQASYDTAADRAAAIKQCLADLHTLADLQRAVLLVEWRADCPGDETAEGDRVSQAALIEWFSASVQDVLRKGDPAAVAATIDVIDQTASVLHANGEPATLTRRFAPELAELVVQGPPGIRQASARTLGQIEPSVFIAVPALEQLLQSGAAELRLTAADALANLIQNTLQTLGNAGESARRPAQRSELILTASSVLPAIHEGLDDARPEVRRRCLEAIGLAANALGRLISDEAFAARQPLAAEREELGPLLLALRDQGPVLARSLRDGDASVRVLTHRALEELGHAHGCWVQRCASAPMPEDDLLRGVLRDAVPGLAAALGDDDARVRRSAIDALEMAGPEALPALPALAHTLGDPDRFIRWSAIRTLGKLGPPAAGWAVPGLTHLLHDPDVDLRKAAAAALARLNSPQHAGAADPSRLDAIPDALLHSLEDQDAGTRVAALQALRSLHVDSRPALPVLLRALADPDAHVREAAAQTLGAFGPSARDAVDELRLTLKDPDTAVRHAASAALLSIVPATPR